jgi:hypothetical protein
VTTPEIVPTGCCALAVDATRHIKTPNIKDIALDLVIFDYLLRVSNRRAQLLFQHEL